jgi:hypothetical protein
MTQDRYAFDPASERYVRQDVSDPKLAGDIVLEPGQLAEIADGGPLQGILTQARKLAFDRFGPAGEAELIGSLWWLHREGSVLLIRWRSAAGFHRFAGLVESAWKAAGEQGFVHYLSTEDEPICWSNGLDGRDRRFVQMSRRSNDRH